MPASSQPLVLHRAEEGRQPAHFTDIPANGLQGSLSRKEEKTTKEKEN